MNILALDTSQKMCSVCVRVSGSNECGVFHQSEELGTGHAERLMPMVHETMVTAGLTFAGLDRIAVTTGPGSFTGVRVAIAAARGFALAAKAQIVSLSTHALLAAQLGQRHAVAVIDDARRGQVYFSLFQPESITPSVGPTVLASDTIAENFDSIPSLAQLTGTGSAIAAEHLSKRNIACVEHTNVTPDCRVLASLAADLAADEKAPSPLYLRAPDAKPQSKHRLVRQNAGQVA